MNKNALIILLRNPQLGCVKTRLAAEIGDEGALRVYNALLEHTRLITSEIDSSRLLFYSNFIDNNDSWDEKLYTKFLQEGNSFGIRMCRAFKAAFKEHDKAVIIGSDCIELTSDIIEDAFNKLNKFEVVIGPAKDGGYYLLGLKKIYPELFFNKTWSTPNVFADTLEDINNLGINHYLLPVLSDIDNFEDFKKSKLFEKIVLS
ncbi:MAG: TIGR04282 family arsenosugar biosynthesis glycosyltransferase [Promethearchaeota archaeon]